MIDEQGPEDEQELEINPPGIEEALSMALEMQGQIFLEMREQNLELLKIAAQVGGFNGGQGPLKANEMRQALKTLWELYSEFYSWIDPEEDDDDMEMDEE